MRLSELTLNEIRQVKHAALTKPQAYRVVVGMATCGLSAGAAKVHAAIKKEIEILDLQGITLEVTGCIGMCIYEPLVEVYSPDGERTTYIHVDPAKAAEIVVEHLVKNQPALRYTLNQLVYEQKGMEADPQHQFLKLGHDRIAKEYPDAEAMVEIDEKDLVLELEVPEIALKLEDLPFYRKQKRIVLKNCGVINPEDINDAIAMNAYQALSKVLGKMTPQDVIDVISDSGLRGRGGAGFPTGRKWQFAANNSADQKYFICNADEGDPGAFMDRAVLEGDPHAILEAMTIGGYAIGASQGVIYVRAEYPVAVKRLYMAIAQAKELGLLGENIFGSGFNFDIDIRLGAGAFVCGEETALIASVEGKRGMPRNKPPFPAERGLWGKPTVINNVETLANIAPIIRNGATWFKSLGTEKSPGTKVFALGGKITNTGLIEVPMGISLREIIEDIGGNCPKGKKFKAVQTGGPSGGCITADFLDTPIDFDNLVAIGSMMGSGGMIVMDEDNCMVDIARFFLDFTVDESCGQCVPCREGTKRMLEILDKITNGHATMDDLELLEELSEHVSVSSLCALGQTAPNPVISTIKHFRDEYIAHVEQKVCPAHVCKGLLGYYITDNCRGCTKCVRYCPVKAISGSARNLHHIDQDICIRCGACVEGCVFDAIVTR